MMFVRVGETTLNDGEMRKYTSWRGNTKTIAVKKSEGESATHT